MTFQHERPWTQGPWTTLANDGYDIVCDYAPRTAFVGSAYRPNDGRAIALFPEMAEAILSEFEHLSDQHVRNIASSGASKQRRVRASLADKLRAIGATDA